MAFHVGQKVVCVDDDYIDPRWLYVPNRPYRDKIYTIRQFLPPEYHSSGERAVLLEEISNPIVRWKTGEYETGFPLFRFRPLIERKSSTCAGFEILDDIRKRESVEEFEKRTKKVRA